MPTETKDKNKVVRNILTLASFNILVTFWYFLFFLYMELTPCKNDSH